MKPLTLLTLLCSGLALATDIIEPRAKLGGGKKPPPKPISPPKPPPKPISPPKPTSVANKPIVAPTSKPAPPIKPAPTSLVVSTKKPPVPAPSKPATSTKKPVSTTKKPSTTTKPVSTRKTSTTTSTATPGAACAYCGEFKPKKAPRDEQYSGMFARAAGNAPVCIRPPPEDIAKDQKRDVSESLVSSLFSRFSSLNLQSRALSDKNSKVDTPLGKAGGYQWIFSLGKYAPSGDAVSIPQITKYWQFKSPSNPQGCSVELEKVATGSASDFETDHVFEAQTFANFIKWLADEDTATIGTSYKKPSALWVEQVLIGETNPFRIDKPGKTNPGDLFTPPGGEIPVVLMAYGFGRSDGVKSKENGVDVERIPTARGNNNLVLLHGNINGPKGIYFKKNKPDPKFKTHTTQLESRIEVRRGVGPFTYLAASDGTTDTMWKKWARVANWIDLVCHTFDQKYTYGSRAGEPTNSKGTPSLRSLWAFFIDKELDDIEAKAALWAADAKKGFDAKWKTATLSPAEKKWRDDAFGANGFATAAKLKFPRPAGLPAGASKYGAYGWSAVTFDAGNKNPNIGSPIKIT